MLFMISLCNKTNDVVCWLVALLLSRPMVVSLVKRV